MSDALTPNYAVIQDDFDGATIVRQSPVSAATGISEGWHTLGFEWNQKFPDVVFLTVGTQGIQNVMGVAFNADGEIIHQVDKASALTEYGDQSTRRFMLTWDNFVKVATGRVVKMKVESIDTYTVSSFGTTLPNSMVNLKFPPFLAKVNELRSQITR